MTHAVDVDALVHVAELSLAQYTDERHTLARHLEVTPRRRTRVVRVVRLDDLRVVRDTCSRCAHSAAQRVVTSAMAGGGARRNLI